MKRVILDMKTWMSGSAIRNSFYIFLLAEIDLHLWCAKNPEFTTALMTRYGFNLWHDYQSGDVVEIKHEACTPLLRK